MTTETKIDLATLCETAACLWEAALEANREHGAPGSPAREAAPAWAAAMLDRWDNYGACEMRALVCGLAADADSGWRLAQSRGFESPFDWEFCPAFIARCVDWEAGGLVSDWRDVCAAIGRADSTQVSTKSGGLN